MTLYTSNPPTSNNGRTTDGPLSLGVQFKVTATGCTLKGFRWYQGYPLWTGTPQAALYAVGGSTTLTTAINDAPGSPASASSEPAGADPWGAMFALYSDTSTRWLGTKPTTGTPQWIKFIPDETGPATGYTITPHPSNQTYSPVDWKFQGSNDGSSWTDLDTRSGITWPSNAAQHFTFSNSTTYSQYRLIITANNGASDFVAINFFTIDGVPTIWSQWREALLGTPYALSNGTDYRAAFLFPTSRPTSPGTLSSDLVSGPLTVPSNAHATNGNHTFASGASMQNPTGAASSSYMIDVIVEQTIAATPQSFTGSPARIIATAPKGAFTFATPMQQSFTGTRTSLLLSAQLGSFVAGVKQAQSYTGLPSKLLLRAPAGSFAASSTQAQSFIGLASSLLLTAPLGRFSSGATAFKGLPARLLLSAPKGSYTTASEAVSANSSVEFSSSASTPADTPAGDLVSASSSAEFSSEAATPGTSESLSAGSSVSFSGHAATGFTVQVDPSTKQWPYRVIVVDSFGVPGPELHNAQMGDRTQALKARGGFEFSLPKDDPKAAYLPQYAQVQVWLGDKMLPEAWFYVVDEPKQSNGRIEYKCSGLRWLFENVRIGKELPELLKNGGFEEGLKYWHPTWFKGSASEAPPETEIVTGVAALDGGKALQTTAVESVNYTEQKTDAIFLGNRPYAWEPLANGFVSGGEQIIRDMVAAIPKGTHITVECYTADVDGGDGQELSERRAAASKNVIHASRPDLIVTDIGRGETVQVAPNDTPANQAKNRRIVITYTASRVGHRQAVTQRFTFENDSRLPIDLWMNGWINLIQYVGPSKDRWGFYIDRRKPSAPNKILDYQTTDLPPTFPHEKWVPDGTSIVAPPDGQPYLYEVRLYGAAGDSKFDEISVKPDLSLNFYNVDKPTALRLLVQHGQDTSYGKVGLNVTTSCPAYGPKDDYQYHWDDHTTVDDAISEIISADDAPDFWIATTPTQRIAKTAGRRGRSTGIVFEVGGMITSYESAPLGDSIATTAIVTSSRDGGGAAEAFVRGPALNGLVLERLRAAEPNRQVSRLKAIGRSMIKYGRTDVLTRVGLDSRYTVKLLGQVGPGDVAEFRVDINASGRYRIVGITHEIRSHKLFFDLVPEA